MAAAFTLARWFTQPMDISGPVQDEEREEVLSALARATAYAEYKDVLYIKTDIGIGAVVPDADTPALMRFQFVWDGYWKNVTFWMNKSSVQEMLDRVRQLPQVDATRLFVYGE